MCSHYVPNEFSTRFPSSQVIFIPYQFFWGNGGRLEVLDIYCSQCVPTWSHWIPNVFFKFPKCSYSTLVLFHCFLMGRWGALDFFFFFFIMCSHYVPNESPMHLSSSQYVPNSTSLLSHFFFLLGKVEGLGFSLFIMCSHYICNLFPKFSRCSQ